MVIVMKINRNIVIHFFSFGHFIFFIFGKNKSQYSVKPMVPNGGPFKMIALYNFCGSIILCTNYYVRLLGLNSFHKSIVEKMFTMRNVVFERRSVSCELNMSCSRVYTSTSVEPRFFTRKAHNHVV